jgi:hypothetical protein
MGAAVSLSLPRLCNAAKRDFYANYVLTMKTESPKAVHFHPFKTYEKNPCCSPRILLDRIERYRPGRRRYPHGQAER